MAFPPTSFQATLTISRVWPRLQTLPLPLQKHDRCKRPAMSCSKKSLYKNPEKSCVHYQSRNGNCAANGVPAETSQLLTLLDRVTRRCAVPDKTLNSSVLLTGRRSRLSCFRLDLLDCVGVSVCERTAWSNRTVFNGALEQTADQT